jgi:hypothetical protein
MYHRIDKESPERYLKVLVSARWLSSIEANRAIFKKELFPLCMYATERQIVLRFGAFALFLFVIGLFTNSNDWWLDIAFFALLYGVLWLLVKRFPQSPTTLTWLVILPVPHLLGGFGLYSWSVGGVSWDVYVHILDAFNGVLLLHSFLTTSALKVWRRALAIILVVLLAGALLEAVEEYGGVALARNGEGLFYRGPGDYCSNEHPCSTSIDTVKDTYDNILGLALGVLAVVYLTAVQRAAGRGARRSRRPRRPRQR